MDMEMQEACMPFKLQGTEQVLTLEILSLLACSLSIILFLMLKKKSDLHLFFLCFSWISTGLYCSSLLVPSEMFLRRWGIVLHLETLFGHLQDGFSSSYKPCI